MTLIFATVFGAIGWLAFLGMAFYSFKKQKEMYRSQQEQVRIETQLHESQKRLDEQKLTFEESQKKMEQSFKVLASEALSLSSESFLKLASERLDKKTTEASGVFEQKVQNFQKLIEPIKQSMTKVENDLTRVEKERLAQFSRISEQLLAVSISSESLRKEASSLTSALRRPEVRGSWGEIQLRRVVELAGMSSYCDFEEQVTTQGEDGLQKPDMIVRLPNNRVIIVDSKAVLDAFLDAVQAETSDKKADALIRHAKNIRSRVNALSKKSYWEQFPNTPDFAVLFIPNEALLGAAVEVDRDLIEDALAEKIVIATPTTLVALLKAVAYGWQQNQLAENAQKVIGSAKELYERLGKWTEHISAIGDKLESATKSYNMAIGSFESRVMPSVRRINELGIGETEQMPEISTIDLVTRKLAVPQAVDVITDKPTDASATEKPEPQIEL